MLEALLARNMEKYFETLLITQPNSADVESFTNLTKHLDDINENEADYMDCIDNLSRALLTEKRLNDEICKLIVMLCDKYV